jgi:hypothetical protein
VIPSADTGQVDHDVTEAFPAERHELQFRKTNHQAMRPFSSKTRNEAMAIPRREAKEQKHAV